MRLHALGNLQSPVSCILTLILVYNEILCWKPSVCDASDYEAMHLCK